MNYFIFHFLESPVELHSPSLYTILSPSQSFHHTLAPVAVTIPDLLEPEKKGDLLYASSNHQNVSFESLWGSSKLCGLIR